MDASPDDRGCAQRPLNRVHLTFQEVAYALNIRNEQQLREMVQRFRDITGPEADLDRCLMCLLSANKHFGKALEYFFGGESSYATTQNQPTSKPKEERTKEDARSFANNEIQTMVVTEDDSELRDSFPPIGPLLQSSPDMGNGESESNNAVSAQENMSPSAIENMVPSATLLSGDRDTSNTKSQPPEPPEKSAATRNKRKRYPSRKWIPWEQIGPFPATCETCGREHPGGLTDSWKGQLIIRIHHSKHASSSRTINCGRWIPNDKSAGLIDPTKARKEREKAGKPGPTAVVLAASSKLGHGKRNGQSASRILWGKVDPVPASCKTCGYERPGGLTDAWQGQAIIRTHQVFSSGTSRPKFCGSYLPHDTSVPVITPTVAERQRRISMLSQCNRVQPGDAPVESESERGDNDFSSEIGSQNGSVGERIHGDTDGPWQANAATSGGESDEELGNPMEAQNHGPIRKSKPRRIDWKRVKPVAATCSGCGQKHGKGLTDTWKGRIILRQHDFTSEEGSRRKCGNWIPEDPTLPTISKARSWKEFRKAESKSEQLSEVEDSSEPSDLESRGSEYVDDTFERENPDSVGTDDSGQLDKGLDASEEAGASKDANDADAAASPTKNPPKVAQNEYWQENWSDEEETLLLHGAVNDHDASQQVTQIDADAIREEEENQLDEVENDVADEEWTEKDNVDDYDDGEEYEDDWGTDLDEEEEQQEQKHHIPAKESQSTDELRSSTKRRKLASRRPRLHRKQTPWERLAVPVTAECSNCGAERSGGLDEAWHGKVILRAHQVLRTKYCGKYCGTFRPKDPSLPTIYDSQLPRVRNPRHHSIQTTTTCSVDRQVSSSDREWERDTDEVMNTAACGRNSEMMQKEWSALMSAQDYQKIESRVSDSRKRKPEQHTENRISADADPNPLRSSSPNGSPRSQSHRKLTNVIHNYSRIPSAPKKRKFPDVIVLSDDDELQVERYPSNPSENAGTQSPEPCSEPACFAGGHDAVDLLQPSTEAQRMSGKEKRETRPSHAKAAAMGEEPRSTQQIEHLFARSGRDASKPVQGSSPPQQDSLFGRRIATDRRARKSAPNPELPTTKGPAITDNTPKSSLTYCHGVSCGPGLSLEASSPAQSTTKVTECDGDDDVFVWGQLEKPVPATCSGCGQQHATGLRDAFHGRVIVRNHAGCNGQWQPDDQNRARILLSEARERAKKRRYCTGSKISSNETQSARY